MEAPAQPPAGKARHLRVPVRADEEQEIKRRARVAGLSVASYLRSTALDHRIPGMLDQQCVEQLARVNGDLGRLGGLLKLWLTDDPRTAQFGEATILAVLSKIEDTQVQMQEIMRSVVLHGGRGKRF